MFMQIEVDNTRSFVLNRVPRFDSSNGGTIESRRSEAVKKRGTLRHFGIEVTGAVFER